jgi:CRP/FNR family transcriptional activator FtrB
LRRIALLEQAPQVTTCGNAAVVAMAASMHLKKASCSAGDWGGKERIVGSLRSIRLFPRLPVADLCWLATEASSASYGNGGVLFRQGEPADTLFVVASGHVGVFLGEPGDYGCLAGTAGRGELLGEAAIIGFPSYPASAQMLSEGQLVAIPAAAVRHLLSEHFEMVLALMGEMSVKIRRQIREIMDLKMKTAPQRLAGHLAMLTPAQQGPAEVRLPYEKKLLASQLGMQPETLSRALMRLQALGVSNGAGSGCFCLRDVALLRRYASDDAGCD